MDLLSRLMKPDVTDETLPTDLGRGSIDRMRAENDPWPGVADNGEFVLTDADAPAYDAGADDIMSVLRDIRGLLAGQGSAGRAPLFYPIVYSLPAGAGETSLAFPGRFRSIFVSPVPRRVAVYAGQGRTMLLGSLEAGQYLNGTIPFDTNGITLVWGAGSASDTFVAHLSNERVDIDVGGGVTSYTGPVGPPIAVPVETVVTVTDASTALAAANADRASLLVRNDHATDTVWLSSNGPAVDGSGFPLPAGAAVVYTHALAVEGVVSTATGTASVAVIEESY